MVYVLDVVVVVTILILGFFFAYNPSNYVSIIFVLLSLLVIVRLLCALLNFKEAKKNVAVLLLFFILILPIFKIARIWRDITFQNQLPIYNDLVRILKIEELKGEEKLHKIPVPAGYNHLVKLILAARSNDRKMIEFHTGGGFPVKHVGYLYDSEDQPETDPFMKERWPKLRRLGKNWYAFSD